MSLRSIVQSLREELDLEESWRSKAKAALVGGALALGIGSGSAAAKPSPAGAIKHSSQLTQTQRDSERTNPQIGPEKSAALDRIAAAAARSRERSAVSDKQWFAKETKRKAASKADLDARSLHSRQKATANRIPVRSPHRGLLPR
jgi:hypothetical protein